MDRDSPQFLELVKLVGPQPEEIYGLALRVSYASCQSFNLRRFYAPEGYHAAVTVFLSKAAKLGIPKPDARSILLAAREVAAYTNALQRLDSSVATIRDLYVVSATRAIPVTKAKVLSAIEASLADADGASAGAD